MSNPPPSQSNDIQVRVEGVASLLNDLQSHKACGPDGIPPCLLKETANNVAPALSLTYTASLTQGQLPNDWKKSYVVPIFKKGSRSSPPNYQPISLTCIPCKMLNTLSTPISIIILAQIKFYVNSNMASEKTIRVKANS